MMGLDWRQETWASYTMALQGWNKRHTTDNDKPAADVDRLRKFAAVH